jgi:hypothetical protein
MSACSFPNLAAPTEHAMGILCESGLQLQRQIVSVLLIGRVTYRPRDGHTLTSSAAIVSGVAAPTVQYWVSNRFNIEVGAGLGFWSVHTGDEKTGLGLILGTGLTIFNRGKHNLQFGVHYSPAFTDPRTVHNLGFTFGYQFL